MKTEKNQNQIDMLQGSLLKGLLLFALPLAASSILQQLFNAIDVAVVGQFATSQDQAAVGCNGAVINLLVNLFVGLSVGANVVIAGCLGHGDQKKASEAVHTSMLIAVLSGVFLMLTGLLIARPILVLLNTPADTLELAVLYLRIYFLGMPFIMIYNFGAAVLRSVGDTRRPLYCLVVTGVLNALLNLLFVIRFGMGVAGVAVATVIANVVSAGILLYWLLGEPGAIRLRPRAMRLHGAALRRILQIGVPAGLQGMVFSIANAFIQAALNGLGSDAVAGSAIAINYEYMTYFVIGAFNQAAVSFVSQNYGAGRPDRCRKVFWLCLACSTVFTAAFSGVIVLNGHFFAALFSTKAAVIEYARVRMLIILTLNCIAGSYEIGGAALRGLGYSMTPAALTVFGTCALRLAWIATAFRRSPTYEMLLIVYPVSWVVTGVAVLTAYFVIANKAYQKMETKKKGA